MEAIVELSEWQARFFEERVAKPQSGDDGVYFREQVFGAVDVLTGALPELEATLGTANFRFFVREFLSVAQPGDALGHSLVAPFLEFLSGRDELRSLDHVQQSIVEARASAYEPSRS
jgi:hypothetical protein